MRPKLLPFSREYPFVAVWWDDPESDPAAVINKQNADKHHKGAPMLTIGWLVKENSEGVQVCNEYLGDGDYRGGTFILAPLVRKVKVLRKVSPSKPPAEAPER